MPKSNQEQLAHAIGNAINDLQKHYSLLLRGFKNLSDLKQIIKETRQLEAQLNFKPVVEAAVHHEKFR